ncbi:hypothetical protein [Terribacillus sp. 7520-G]|nr:hypothetical protein [Terribacillus sp. 7520-G]
MDHQLDNAIKYIDKTLAEGQFDPLMRLEMLEMKQMLERAANQDKSP